MVGGMRVLTDTNGWQARIGYRDLQGDSITWTGQKTPHSRTGIAPFRVDARYHCGEVIIPAGTEWSKIYGFDIDVVATGYQ